MYKIKPFAARSFALSGAYDTEINGLLLGGIQVQADFSVTDGGGGSAARTDAAYRLLGTLELNQAEDPLIRMAGPDWLHLAALLNGGYPSAIQDDIATGATEGKLAVARIPFGKIIPGMAVNASRVKAYVRGQFGSLADYSDGGGNLSTITGQLRPFVEAIDGNPQRGFIRPRITQATVDVSTANDNIPHVIRFEQDTLLPGIMLRAYDASAATAHNADGLIRKLRVEITDDNGTTEVHRLTWGQAREFTVQRFGLNPADAVRSAGIVWLPFSEKAGIPGNAKLFKAGHSITITIDTLSTVESHLTAVTPANGDLLYVTSVGGVAVAATGDTAGNQRKIVDPQVARARARNAGLI